jgi:hypothetical protein
MFLHLVEGRREAGAGAKTIHLEINPSGPARAVFHAGPRHPAGASGKDDMATELFAKWLADRRGAVVVRCERHTILRTAI